MEEQNNILLASVRGYLNGDYSAAELNRETAELLMKCARKHKVLPIVYLENSGALKNILTPQEYAVLRNEIIIITSAQIRRGAELVRLCSILKNAGIKHLVFKGAACRALYKNPEYRTSSDEDILTGADSEKAAELLEKNGYSVIERNNGEITLLHKPTGLLAELHSSITATDGSEELNRIGSMLLSQLDNPYKINTEYGQLDTFEPTYGFLCLCMHFYNHFVRGGIGIRPVMDIACFIRAYYDEIDFDFCFSTLATVRAEKLIKAVIALCGKYFGTGDRFDIKDGIIEELLEDIMSAGVYGTADAGRVHSGTVTRKMAGSGKGFLGSLISAAVPTEEEIVLLHPELEGLHGEIRKYRVKRILKFAGKKKNFTALACAGRRNRLLRELGISE